MEVELVPQGTLIERIRAGGVGLGGVLTGRGIGTPVEEGKQKVEVNGKSYLRTAGGNEARLSCDPKARWCVAYRGAAAPRPRNSSTKT